MNAERKSVQWIWIVALVIIAIAIFVLLKNGGQDEEQDRVVIGAVLPLTGDAATFGSNALRGADLAVEEVNSSSSIQFALLSEDSRGNPAEAASAARKLIQINGAQLLIGDVTSAGTHAVIPVATEEKVPVISPSASDPALSGVSAYFARVWPSDVYEASVIASHAEAAEYSMIAIVLANTDYGVAMVNEFEGSLAGPEVTTTVRVDRETLDYRPTIERVRLADPEAIFMVLYPEDAKRFLQQADELGLDLPILATATFEDPSLAELPNSTRVVFASPKPPTDSQVRNDFIERFEEVYGEAPGVLADTGYDAAMILMKSYLETMNDGTRSLMEYIRSLDGYDGASGSMSFDENGDVEKEYGLKTVTNKQFVWVNDAGDQGPQ